MENKEKIKFYWQRINKIEERIKNLADRRIDYSLETKKRKSMINNVKRLERENENTKKS